VGLDRLLLRWLWLKPAGLQHVGEVADQFDPWRVSRIRRWANDDLIDKPPRDFQGRSVVRANQSKAETGELVAVGLRQIGGNGRHHGGGTGEHRRQLRPLAFEISQARLNVGHPNSLGQGINQMANALVDHFQIAVVLVDVATGQLLLLRPTAREFLGEGIRGLRLHQLAAKSVHDQGLNLRLTRPCPVAAAVCIGGDAGEVIFSDPQE